jgi:hypothetical protein
VLEAFFRREQRFFLSGGAALAGFHLAHRRTHDLALLTTVDVIEDGEQALALMSWARRSRRSRRHRPSAAASFGAARKRS